MLSEKEVLLDLDHVLVVLLVVAFHVLQDAHFNHRLLVETLLVPDDLQSYQLLFFVIERLYNLSKRTLPQPAHNLVTVHYVIVQAVPIVPPIVVVSCVTHASF